jgi:hypothetical protein
MKRWLLIGMVLSLVGMAWAQAGPGKDVHQGPLPFNPGTIETVQGLVVDAPEFKTGGIPEMVHLTLKAKTGKFSVVLGPNWFLAQKGWKISALDHIEVVGSRINLEGRNALIAQQVKKGDLVMKFRDESGRPLWVTAQPQPH